ncbi:fibrous sheath CABYR-binding protein-like isoform X2 [Dermacentor silvarum]|uniref:fibrous sheath CABYR-binding protein-like isoform X2 n=1 Tax=Dermacentor silvarum TaxID=543639 RepID=UPI002100C5D5|nr:fibrous sheath CABYR-binding protein-like isoform X2 [Dermacentor silvarum]
MLRAASVVGGRANAVISSARFMALSSAWFFSNVAYTVLFVYATEIFPTVIRALSFNLGAGFGRIGTIIAPYLYQGTDSKFMSFLILAFTCGLSGFLVGKLPNTKEVHLPEIVKPEENLFDFTPMRPHPSRSRGGTGLSPQDGSPNTTLQVPALPKVSTSKLPSPVASTPDQNVSSWVKPQAKHFASSHHQRRRSVKPALKELGRTPTSVVTASETRPSGPKLSFCEPVAGGATQSAPAATSAATEDEKPAVQLADDDAEQKRASLETVPFANEVFREDRPNAESPKGQEGIPFSGTSVDAAKSPSESPGQCRSPPSIVVDPAGTTRPMEGPHLGDPELLSSPSPVAAASTAVATETMERWSATTHHFSPVRDSIPAEVASPTFRRVDAETGSPLQAVATIASGGVTPARSSSPSRPTTRRLGVDDVASTAEAPMPPERLEHRDEVGARAVQAMSVRAAEPVKKAGTLQSPRHSLEGAGSGVLARPENVDRRLASPLRRHIKNPASPKLKRNKLSKHRLPRGGHHR